MNSRAKALSSNPRSAIYLLCDLGQVTFSMHHAEHGFNNNTCGTVLL